MSQSEDILKKRIKELEGIVNQCKSYDIELIQKDNRIQILESLLSKYTAWFATHAKWVNLFNRIIRWNPEQGQVERFKITREELEPVFDLMEESIK